jgi:hypothetical protein
MRLVSPELYVNQLPLADFKPGEHPAFFSKPHNPARAGSPDSEIRSALNVGRSYMNALTMHCFIYRKGLPGATEILTTPRGDPIEMVRFKAIVHNDDEELTPQAAALAGQMLLSTVQGLAHSTSHSEHRPWHEVHREGKFALDPMDTYLQYGAVLLPIPEEYTAAYTAQRPKHLSC